MTLLFNVGDLVTIGNTFKVSGVATDPTAISLAVTSPAGTTTTYTYAAATITRVGTGVYSKDVTADAVGIWRYAWTGTTAAADVADGTFEVFATADRTLYVSPEAMKGQLNVNDTDDDAYIRASCTAASRMVDRWCGQRFWQDATAQTLTFYADDWRSVRLNDVSIGVGGISTSVGLIVKTDEAGAGTYGTTVAINTDFQLHPLNAAAFYPAQPFTELWMSDNYAWPLLWNGRAAVQVTAKFGWPAIPDEVQRATLIQAIELYKAKDAAFGVAGSADFGVLRVRPNLHPIALALLSPFQVPALG